MKKKVNFPLAVTLIVLCGVLLVVVVLQCGFLTKPSKQPSEELSDQAIEDGISDWKTYRNKEYGFEIKYPEEWQLHEPDDKYGNIAIFAPPGDIEGIWLRFNISTEETSGLSLEMFTYYHLAELKQKGLMEFESKDVTLAGKSAHQIITPPYQIPDTNKNWKSKTIWTVHNNKAYILTYLGPEEDFDSYSQVVEKMIDSFKFTD